jgi:MSHA pilin protein MshC
MDCALHKQRPAWVAGFTLVELITVMIIVGIMAAIVAPRFFDANVFKSRGFADQVQASLRYAQKTAIAQHRLVCVALASSSITLTIASTSAAVTCTIPLAFSAGGNFINAPSGVTLSPAVTINFDALGKTTATQTITVSGATNNIIVEAETGYVHSP